LDKKEINFMESKGICLMACNSGMYFAKKIIPYLNYFLEKENLEKINITKTEETHFINTEIKSNILESIRGKDVFIVQDVSNRTKGLSVNDNVMALKTLIDSARISDARRINLIIPTFPYARQDKPFGREGITAKMFSKELDMLGVYSIITLDIHNLAINGFFNNSVIENLKGFRDLIVYIKENINTDNLVISSPDLGGIKRAENYASYLKKDLITIYKDRNYKQIDKIDKIEVIGKVKGKDVLLVDDMIDTGGTVYNSIKLLKEKGANKIYVVCSLPFLNGKAVERMNELYNKNYLTNLIGTNAVYHSKDFLENNKWFIQVPVESYFAKVIFNLYTRRSISNLLSNIR
jgi:ribose-phosphate pyrophosphokinase